MPNLRRTEEPNLRAGKQRMTWEEICRDEALRGRWIALDDCCFDEASGRALEGLVVDADDDLAELCNRMRASQWRNCSIVFAHTESPPQRRPRLN
jgi:hypothetical protein